MKTFLIAPPFGNYLSNPNCTSVHGSFTLERRPGLVWNTLKSLRPIRGGWVNRIGLRNPGIKSLQGRYSRHCIYSIVGLEPDDWGEMLHYIPDGMTVELNLGCPNVHRYGIEPDVLRKFVHHFRTIVKLPATDLVHEVAEMAVSSGVTYLHASNTIPTPRGGESGQRLKKHNEAVIPVLRATHPSASIIAGGGIYSWQDVERYAALGADHFSLGTVWFRPWLPRSFLSKGPPSTLSPASTAAR